jgi:hypothetical protein
MLIPFSFLMTDLRIAVDLIKHERSYLQRLVKKVTKRCLSFHYLAGVVTV